MGLAKEPEIPEQYAARAVVSGCPAASTPLGTPNPYFGLNAARYASGESSPSEHLVYIYFVSREVYAATFGDEPFVRGPEEFICQGHVCIEATVGVYFPDTVAADVLEAGLMRALVLPRPEIPGPVFDWSACERGEQPHPDYTCDQYEDWLD